MVAQHLCVAPPHGVHAPFAHSERPAMQSVPAVAQMLLPPQQPPFRHIWLAQQGPPAIPHGEHIPLAQPSPMPQVLPPQHGWFAPPHPTHIEFEHTMLAPQVWPFATQVLLPPQQPLLHTWLAQQGVPTLPHV